MWSRAVAAARGFAWIARAYLLDRERRAALIAAAAPPPRISPPEVHPAQHVAPAPDPLPAAESPYSGLTPYSTSMLRLVREDRPPAVNLVLPEVDPGGIFAGVRTALEVGRLCARRDGAPLRLLLLKSIDADDRAQRLTAIRQRIAELGVEADVIACDVLERHPVGTADRWIATHWWTAHALDVAARSGLIDPTSVLYLVQDYEPGFVGWSTDSAVAASTYGAGFTALANSTPVARHLEHEGHGAPAAVFAPALDVAELEAAAARRRRSDRARIFFYARPSKPRNLFGLGVAALRLAIRRSAEQGVPIEIVTAGEPIGQHAIPGARFEDLGTLRREEYFAMLSRVDLGLTLQASPHPSHPPLELAVSGARAVVNDVDGQRGRLHPRITAAPASPDALADAIVTGARAVLADDAPSRYAPLAPLALGDDLPTALMHALAPRP